MAVETIIRCDKCYKYVQEGDDIFCEKCYEDLDGKIEELEIELLELTQENEALKDELE